MSERRVLTLLLACAGLVAPLRAQELEQLQRQEARLLARREELTQQVSREAEGRFRSERRTVLTVGPVHVAYPEWAAATGGDDLAAALRSQLDRYGTAADSLLAGDTIYIWVDEQEAGRAARVKYRVGGWQGGRTTGIDSTHSGAWVAAVAVAALDEWALQTLLDLPLAQWLGNWDQRNTVASLRDPIVRDLVGSPSARAQRCLNGAAEECRLVLELDEGATPLLSAYALTDLPGLFQRMDLGARIPGRANCVGKRDAAACAELVRLGRARPPHPLSMRSRQSLFAYAIASGGADAWLRLHRAHGRPLAEQLGAAAGKPVDSLVAAWQRDLLAGRRATTAGLTPSLMLTLAWGVVTTLFFAWRYRWRHV